MADHRLPKLAGRQAPRKTVFSTGPTRWVVVGTVLSILSIAAAAGLQIRKDHAAALTYAETQASTVIATMAGALSADLRNRLQRSARLLPRLGLAGLQDADPAIGHALKVRSDGYILEDRSGLIADGRQLTNMALIQTAIASRHGMAAGRLNEVGYTQGMLGLVTRLPTQGEALLLIIKPEALSEVLGAGLANRPESILLADAKARLIASSSGTPSWAAQVLDDLPAKTALRPNVTYVNRLDGASVLAAIAPVPGFDVSVISFARASAKLDGWISSLPLYSIMLLGPSLLGAGLAWALLNQIERRTRVDSLLRRTEERFELAIAGARCGIWDWDLRSDRIYWSGAMQQLLGRGRTAGAKTRAQIMDLVHPEDRAVLDEIRASIQGGETVIDKVMRFKHADGYDIAVRLRGQIHYGVLAHTERLMAVAMDVSDQQAAISARSEAKQRLREAVDAAAESFALWDADGGLVMANRQFLTFYGIDEVRAGESEVDVLARAHLRPEPHAAAETLRQTHVGVGDGEIALEKAGSRWLLVRARGLAGGGRVVVATDITALKLQEDELVRRESELSRTVAELESSRRLMQTQAAEMSDLMQKFEAEKTKAEGANRAKSEFLANMSHELRTPLNAILGFSDVMRNAVFGPLPGKYSEYANDIHRSGQHLLDLVNDILAMAKIEAGKLKLELAPVDVPQIISDAVHAAEPEARAKRLPITIAADGMASVLADRRAVKQVLMNLLSNAIKFTPAGGAITVAAAELDGEVRVSVTDTGVGIPTEELQRVVKPFERLSPVKINRQGGAGLGLAVSKALVDLHQGELSIDSKVGAGTCVSFTLPLAPHQSATAA